MPPVGRPGQVIRPGDLVPGGARAKPRKKKRIKRKLPGGLVAFSPGPKPKITGEGKRWKVGQPGAGKYANWWVARPITPKAAGGKKPKTKKPGPPGPAPGPYDVYKDVPGAIAAFEQLDRDQAHHQGYVSGQVLPWLSSGLTALTGVNPGQQGYNPTIQQQYLANIQGQVGGALNAAAAATPMSFGATTPGASTAAPNAYQGAAMREYSAQRGGAAIMDAQAKSAMYTAQPNLYAQSAMRTMADYAAGLPEVYVRKRGELRDRIDEFRAEMAQQAETMRHNKVQEAISAQNASTNAAIQFGRLGLSAEEVALDTANDAAEAAAPVPHGFVRLPDGRIARDPNVPAARATSPGGSSSSPGGTSTRDAQGRPKVGWLQTEGYRRVGGTKKPKVPAGWKLAQGADGRWWVKKPGTSGGGSKPKAATPPQSVYEKLVTANDKGLISSAQNEGTPDLLRFLRPLQPSAKGPAWNKWFAQVLDVLDRVDPNYAEWIEGWVLRRKRDKTWKGRF
jgi:hypothetical protein